MCVPFEGKRWVGVSYAVCNRPSIHTCFIEETRAYGEGHENECEVTSYSLLLV
jgi:hypothetical protein